MESRVTAHTIGGTVCSLPGLHRYDGDFTMPSRCRVAVCLNQEWIRPATKEETAQHGKWYHVLSFMPTAIIHSNGIHAGIFDTLGQFGDNIIVLAHPPVDDVPKPETTPSTPPTASTPPWI